MPVVLDRLPLPNLTLYSSFSVLLLGCSVYFAAVHVLTNPSWRDEYVSNELSHNFLMSNKDSCRNPFYNGKEDLLKNYGQESVVCKAEEFTIFKHYTFVNNTMNLLKIDLSPHIVSEILSYMFHEPLCIWTLINLAYCCLILLGTTIQHLVFGELRVSEQQHIKDKFWNFVFYKFIFVFGVMNVQLLGEVILWCSWFSVLGFLHLLALLCKDRFEYLSFSPSTSKRTHTRLLGLLGIVFMLAISCFLISIVVGFHASMNTFAFMAAECILLIMRTLHVICRYGTYLWDITYQGLWEKRGRYMYFTELTFELSELIIDMVHHIHMLVWGNMWLTMASLVIFMQIRMLFYQIKQKIKSHKNYLRVVRLIKSYPEVSGGGDEDFTCAICWELVETGRQLNCTHIFHGSCLQAWLHHDLSCPTCRNKLKQSNEDVPLDGLLSHLLPNEMEDSSEDSQIDTRSGRTFRSIDPSNSSMEGSQSRYVSWLSSFSVEQSHTQLPRHHQTNGQQLATSQLDNMARQVKQIFPDISYPSILEDLQRTRSLEDTIDNLLEHRIDVTPPMFTQNDQRKEHNSEEKIELSKEKCEVEVRRLRESMSDTDSESSDVAESSSSRFSKSGPERELILEQRKNALFSLARQKFMKKSS